MPIQASQTKGKETSWTPTTRIYSYIYRQFSSPILHVFGLWGKLEPSEETHEHANFTQKDHLASCYPLSHCATQRSH